MTRMKMCLWIAGNTDTDTVPQTRFGDAVLSLGCLNSTANQNWGRGTFITSGTSI